MLPLLLASYQIGKGQVQQAVESLERGRAMRGFRCLIRLHAADLCAAAGRVAG
jgi:hypothetical protein